VELVHLVFEFVDSRAYQTAVALVAGAPFAVVRTGRVRRPGSFSDVRARNAVADAGAAGADQMTDNSAFGTGAGELQHCTDVLHFALPLIPEFIDVKTTPSLVLCSM